MAPGIPLLFALLLAATAVAATLAFTLPFGTEAFPSILYACTVNGLGAGDCLAKAREAGALSVVAYVGVLGFGVWRRWFSADAIAGSGGGSPAQGLFAAASLAVMIGHAGILLFGPAHVSRLDETEAYSHLVSVENLLLPLLLQVYVSAGPTGRWRLPLLAALLMGMALSPYRAMVMALYLFGMVLPLLLMAHQEWRRGMGGRRWGGVAREGGLALVVGIALALAGAQNTEMRSPTLLAHSLGLAALPAEHPLSPKVIAGITQRRAQRPSGRDPAREQIRDQAVASLARPAAEMLLPPADLPRRLTQRVVFPLYQAAIAGHLVDDGTPFPSLGDQLLRKLRLSDAPNLEEFLFRHIYGGEGHGETTSLTYGEARVYFPGPALLWMTAVPLLLVLGWRMLARRGMDCATLFGLALWRSSFSGLFPILPALLLQGAGLWLLRRWPLNGWAGAARLLLGLALAVALLVQAWTLGSLLLGRRDVLYARFELERGCWLESPTVVPLDVDRVGRRHGMPMSPVMVANHRTALILALPYGQAAAEMLDDSRGAIAQLSRCGSEPAAGVTPDKIRLLDTHLVGRPINLLEILIVLVLAVGLWRFRRSGETQ